MHKNILDLEIKRDLNDTFIFYLFYSISGSLLLGLLTLAIIFLLHFDIKNFDEYYFYTKIYSPIIAIIYGVTLGVSILYSKRLLTSFQPVAVLILSMPVLFHAGIAFGLIPISCLTLFYAKN